jgi:hypothetical protein
LWLVVHVEGREYRMLLDVDPKRRQDLCSEIDYTIEDSGRFEIGTTVTVD